MRRLQVINLQPLLLLMMMVQLTKYPDCQGSTTQMTMIHKLNQFL